MQGRPERDDGPSDEDIDRFGGDDGDLDTDDGDDAAGSRPRTAEELRRLRAGYCPKCGAEVHEDADICPKCFEWITGDVLRRHPAAAGLGRRALIAVGLLLLGVILFLAMRGAF
ncbi:MAG: zinc ribbon domain-containing protein [Planctomycetota bacterium]|nr:zinc ribbon domain-containing protein [Planctomycetota bacterium]